MLKIKEYVRAESLEQAYQLNQKKTNRIIGGMLWMKMSDARIQTAKCQAFFLTLLKPSCVCT